MSTKSNDAPLYFEFIINRLSPAIQYEMEAFFRSRVPGLKIGIISKRETEILYRASSASIHDFVLLGIAIQTFNQQYHAKEANNKTFQAPIGSSHVGGTGTDAAERERA